MTLTIGRRPSGGSFFRVTEGWAGRLAFTAQYGEDGRVLHVRDGDGVYLATLERTNVNEHRLAAFTVYKDTALIGEMLAFPDRTWSKDWLDPTLYVLYRHWHMSHGWITGPNRATAATVTDAALGCEIINLSELTAFTRELKRHGSNLNQLAVLAHTGQIQCADIGEAAKLYADLPAAVGRIRERRRD